jgi:hypothetical protein
VQIETQLCEARKLFRSSLYSFSNFNAGINLANLNWRLKMKTRFLALASVFVVGLGASFSAQAQEHQGGLFVEPGVFYDTGTTTTQYPTGDSGGTSKGFGVAGRLGFHIGEAFFVAADARYSMPKFSDGRIDASGDAYQVGPVVGLQTPVAGLRVWAEYIAQAQLDPGGSNNFDLKFKNGTGFGVGGGFRILAVSLNLEYQRLNYGTTEVQNAGLFSNVDTDNTKLKNEAWIASVSFPIEL